MLHTDPVTRGLMITVSWLGMDVDVSARQFSIGSVVIPSYRLDSGLNMSPLSWLVLLSSPLLEDCSSH